MLMEWILSRENLLTALKRVERNKGSHGMDELPVQNLRKHILEHWESIKMELLEGIYKPQPALQYCSATYGSEYLHDCIGLSITQAARYAVIGEAILEDIINEEI